MRTSSRDPAHHAVMALLLAINVAMFGAWPLLRAAPTGSNGPGDYLVDGQGELRVIASDIVPNDDFLDRVFGVIREHKGILCLGTSETTFASNIGRQINSLMPEDKQRISILAIGGLSPIHRTLVFARLRREGIQLPPTILIINLVYFTESHDVINDGWLSMAMRSPVFVQMNHRELWQHTSEEVRAAYDAHFANKLPLYPVTAQRYLGYNLYLWWHHSPSVMPDLKKVPTPVFSFDGTIPQYDRDRAVHAGHVASDQLAKGRWRVKEAEDSLNLKGVRNSLSILRQQSAPVLILVLPMNRTFYACNGLDMAEFDHRMGRIRDTIRESADARQFHLIDMYEEPEFDMGFEDRMHADAYGNHQMARYIISTRQYDEFLRAADEFHASAGSPAMQPSDQ